MHIPADLLRDNDTSKVVDMVDDYGSFHIYMVTSKNPQKFRQIEVFSIIGVLRLNQVCLLLIF